jgi:hypothetical protein
MACTVAELGRRLSSAELTEWMAMELLEPSGDARADDRARGIMTLIARANGWPDAAPGDFLTAWQPPAASSIADDLADMMAKLDAVAVPKED